MLAAFIKFFHIICGVTFLGITIASFFYITSSIKRNNQSLLLYSLNASFFGDAIILICIITQLITSSFLTQTNHLSLHVPWIFVAYHAFGFIIFLWVINLFIKICWFNKKIITLSSQKIFTLCNIAMIFIFCLVIHDAVNHSTWFSFLWDK